MLRCTVRKKKKKTLQNVVVLVKWNVRSVLNNSDLSIVFHGRDDTLDKVIYGYDN